MKRKKRLSVGLIVTALLGFEHVWAQSTIRGTVRDEAGEPLPDARVEIPALQKGALTNTEGIFFFSKLDGGTYRLRFSYLGKDTVFKEVTVQAGKVATVNVILPDNTAELETVVIEGESFGKIDVNKVNTGVVKVSAQDINLLPTLGTPDLAQYLQVIPGVVFTGDQGGQLFVRGGTPIQNLTLLDGAIVYSPFHTLGLFSVFDTDYIRGVDVYTAGFGAEYGARISSVMDIRTRSGDFQRFRFKAHANTITSGGMAEGPVFKKKGSERGIMSFLLSGRGCYINKTAPTLYDYAHTRTGLPFSFYDLYGKTTIGSGASQVSLFGFHQDDRVDYGFPTDYRWKQSGGGANYLVLVPGTAMTMSGSVAGSLFENRQMASEEALPRASRVGGFNARFNFAYVFNSIHELTYGARIQGFNTDFSFVNSLGTTTRQRDSNTELAMFVRYKHIFRSQTINENGRKEYFNRFILDPSFRIHWYNEHGAVSLEPRLRTKLNFKRVSFQAAGGWYSQNLVSATSDRDVVALFQGFLSAPNVTLDNKRFSNALQFAWHALFGAQVEIIPNLETTVEAWYKNFPQLTNINRERLFPEDRVFIVETGQALGADFILRYQRNKLYVYFTYGIARSVRNDFSIEYPPVFDRRHNVNLVANYKLGELRERTSSKYLDAKWEFSGRFTYGSGFPFTQTQGFFEKINFNVREGTTTDIVTQNGSLGILLSADYNGGRLPAYHRLDFSVKRRFRLFERLVMEINANVINVYNRANIFYFDRIRYARVDQLPIVPTLGVALSF
jgi:hypothetical protein